MVEPDLREEVPVTENVKFPPPQTPPSVPTIIEVVDDIEEIEETVVQSTETDPE